MSLLSHDRYQYDSLILSKQTWAYPRQHLQQLLWCVVSVRLNLPEVEERKLCALRYYANCVSTTLTDLILHNVESVYFFYSNPVNFVKLFHAVPYLCGLGFRRCVRSSLFWEFTQRWIIVIDISGQFIVPFLKGQTLRKGFLLCQLGVCR